MGNESSSGRDGGGGGGNVTSLGDYSDKGSFGKAFNAAHSAGGSGHTFSYNG
jgi:hypothetical protein